MARIIATASYGRGACNRKRFLSPSTSTWLMEGRLDKVKRSVGACLKCLFWSYVFAIAVAFVFFFVREFHDEILGFLMIFGLSAWIGWKLHGRYGDA